ncbi:hypothetical protein Cgig2_006614 [Carnegiea gigantea]|uniref:Uncharacterized protein n=1 Tax=Carnegiea gigantea TaxID=171969 RepID=A0A9Q1QMH7_9CARY|nr:hypothetical protein Cgig2_006614 [Carnegiea gigantea]
MGFPCSLTTDEIVIYVLDNFEWYHREVVFPPRPLPSDYEELCLDFDLAVVEEYADAVKLGVLHRWMIEPTKSCGGTLSRHRWGVTGAESWRPGGTKHPATWKRKRPQGQTTKPPSLVVALRSKARLGMTFTMGILVQPSGPGPEWAAPWSFSRIGSLYDGDTCARY